MKKATILSILFISFLAICQGQDNKRDCLLFYFPSEVFKDTSSFAERRDTFFNTWYSKHLFAMKEPIIYNDESHNEIYRFTWLRTFHVPIVIRIEKQEDSCMLYWKVCNGAGGYNPGELVIDKQKKIDEKTWQEFKRLLIEIDFWNLNTVDDSFGFDGSQWILEGKFNTQYHVVDRWTPNKKSKYYKCCNSLIKLTDLKIRWNKY